MEGEEEHGNSLAAGQAAASTPMTSRRPAVSPARGPVQGGELGRRHPPTMAMDQCTLTVPS
jgi:hypothetical protein